mmetsp:Transcript_15013/g.22006  ORF Transcript_15013/g.22006 Transcript_15013/m.22006 type:complete len:102 (-) Transcript_15013:222-527(-)
MWMCFRARLHRNRLACHHMMGNFGSTVSPVMDEWFSLGQMTGFTTDNNTRPFRMVRSHELYNINSNNSSHSSSLPPHRRHRTGRSASLHGGGGGGGDLCSV